MDDSDTIFETTMDIFGKPYEVKVFKRCNGKHFAMTRFSAGDVIVSDGNSVEDTLRVHASWLPLAVSCRGEEEQFP